MRKIDVGAVNPEIREVIREGLEHAAMLGAFGERDRTLYLLRRVAGEQLMLLITEKPVSDVLGYDDEPTPSA